MDNFSFFEKDKYKTDTKNYTCVSCGLYKYCRSPKMEPVGNFKKGILIIGDTPTAIDDSRGLQFQSKAGRLLRNTLKDRGIDLEEDCLSVNAVRCYSDKSLTKINIEACRVKLLQTIKHYKPNTIICLGDIALQSTIGHLWKKDFDNIHKWRGHTIPDQSFMAWICPVYHPNLVLEGEKIHQTIWEKDFDAIKNRVHKKVSKTKEPKIDYITDLSPLNDIKSGQVCFDYETTGLKPHAKGHRIICVSVADGPDHVYVFVMPKKRKDRKPFIDLLQRNTVYKMAHNMKFEINWTKVRLGIEINQMKFDSQIAAHIIDNRKGVTGLKFQTYVRLGIADYDSDIQPYIKSVDGTANGFNKLIEFMEKNESNKKKLLTYCAYDSVYEYRIAMMQMKEMNYDFLPF